MNPYEKYKPSGVEWIGKVPEHWSICKIKHLAIGENTLFLDGDWIESKDIVFDSENIRYITTGNIGEGKYKEQGSGYITEQTFQRLNCTEVYKGDLVISRLNPPIGRACLIPDLGKRIVTSVDNVILRPNENFNKGYLVFLFSNSNYFTQTSLMARGATMQRLSRGLLGEIAICTPPLPEQTAIARYLDQKTSEIDQLIVQKEHLLALWEEEKTAVINQAVTRGLDAGAKMKDSGVAWLGEVPEHWVVKRLKYGVNKIGSGVTPKGGAEVYKTSGIPLLRSQNIHFDGLRLNDVVFISEEIHDEMSNSKVRTGDVLLNITGASIGRTYFVDDNLGEANVNQHVCILRPNEDIDAKFLYFIFRSSIGQKQIEFEQTGSGREGLNFSALQNFQIPFLNISEQTAIVHHIETQTARIQTQMNQTRKLIELLKEYRATLISEVVTGKIKITEKP